MKHYDTEKSEDESRSREGFSEAVVREIVRERDPRDENQKSAVDVEVDAGNPPDAPRP